MKKTLVCVNALTEIDASVYLTHTQMWYRMGREFPEDKFINYTPTRTNIDAARNFAAKVALESECDYLFFVDDDMLLHEKTYASLRENIERPGVDAVMALTYIRSFPFPPMMFKTVGMEDGKIKELKLYHDFEEHIDPKTYCVEVSAFGCACVLIKVDLLKKMEAPFFVTTPQMTEDVFFCLKAKNLLGPDNVKFLVDCGIPTGHLGDKSVITHQNIPHLNKFYKSLGAEDPDEKKQGDRGNEYLVKIGEAPTEPTQMEL